MQFTNSINFISFFYFAYSQAERERRELQIM